MDSWPSRRWTVIRSAPAAIIHEAWVCRLCGIPHKRHTAASLAIGSGASVKHVQRMLGHKDASMTLNVYASLFEDDLDAVSDRLDAAWLDASAASVRPTAGQERLALTTVGGQTAPD